jgi:hypothetical protein
MSEQEARVMAQAELESDTYVPLEGFYKVVGERFTGVRRNITGMVQWDPGVIFFVVYRLPLGLTADVFEKFPHEKKQKYRNGLIAVCESERRAYIPVP